MRRSAPLSGRRRADLSEVRDARLRRYTIGGTSPRSRDSPVAQPRRAKNPDKARPSPARLGCGDRGRARTYRRGRVLPFKVTTTTVESLVAHAGVCGGQDANAARPPEGWAGERKRAVREKVGRRAARHLQRPIHCAGSVLYRCLPRERRTVRYQHAFATAVCSS